jgi:hypothetical protein
MKRERNKNLIEWGLKLKSKKERGQCCTLSVKREKKEKKNSNNYRR